MPARFFRRRAIGALASVATAGLLVSACGGSGSASDAGGADNGSESAAAETASVVIPTASGGQIDFGALEGTDYVLWFWAPW